MKTKTFLMVLISALSLLAISCSKSDSDSIEKQIIGTWDAVQCKTSSGTWIEIPTRLSLSATFKSDGTYTGRGALGNGSGTYTVSGHTIKTYVDGTLYLTYYVNSISGTQAELTISSGSSSMTIIAEKR